MKRTMLKKFKLRNVGILTAAAVMLSACGAADEVDTVAETAEVTDDAADANAEDTASEEAVEEAATDTEAVDTASEDKQDDEKKYYEYNVEGFKFNIPKGYSVESIGNSADPFVNEMFFSLSNEETAEWSGLHVFSGKNTENNDKLTESGKITTEYGELSVISGVVDESDDSYEVYMYYEKTYIEAEQIITIEYMETEHGEGAHEAFENQDYQGKLEELIPLMLESYAQRINYDLPELSANDIEATEENYTDVLKNNNGDGVFGINTVDLDYIIETNSSGWWITSRGSGELKVNNEDNGETISFLSDESNNMGMQLDICLKHFFMEDTHYGNNTYGNLISINEAERINTAFGEMAVFYVEAEMEGQNIEQEIGLLKNKDSVVAVYYSGRSIKNGNYIPYDGTYDGNIKRCLEELGSL